MCRWFKSTLRHPRKPRHPSARGFWFSAPTPGLPAPARLDCWQFWSSHCVHFLRSTRRTLSRWRPARRRLPRVKLSRVCETEAEATQPALPVTQQGTAAASRPSVAGPQVVPDSPQMPVDSPGTIGGSLANTADSSTTATFPGATAPAAPATAGFEADACTLLAVHGVFVAATGSAGPVHRHAADCRENRGSELHEEVPRLSGDPTPRV